MKINIYQHFKIWLLLFFIVDAIVIVINGNAGESGSNEPPITLLLTGGFMLYTPILIGHFLKTYSIPSRRVMFVIFLYCIGIMLVTLTRDDVTSEIPRALITAISIWSGLVLGTCIGLSPKLLKIFTSILLFFGVTVSILSVSTGIGISSNINGISMGRDNRLWTNAFTIVDPICMFGAGCHLINQYYTSYNLSAKIQYFTFTLLALILLLYSSTRSYLIQLFILLGFGILSRFSKVQRSFLVPNIVVFSIVIVIWITQASDLQNIAILNQFGFLDANGSVALEKSRSLLHDHLIELFKTSPILGVGINEVKQSSALIDNAAKTEYGYYLHIAAFGFIVSTPFYLVMIWGGFLRPLAHLANSPAKSIAKTFPIHGMAVGCFLAGFNGYYAQATSVGQFISLMFIGISIQLDSFTNQSYISKVSEDAAKIRKVSEMIL